MQIRLVVGILLALTSVAPVCGADDAAEQAEEEQLNAQLQQYVQMLQPVMWRELEFIRLTCELAPEQRSKIKTAADESVKRAARDFTKRRRQGGPNNPQEMVRKDIAKVLQETLKPEQFAAYTEEAARRTTSRKKGAITGVVAQLDATLFLSPEQRDKISQTLEANWEDDWEQWLQLWQYGGRYFPQIPGKHLTPHLNADQIKVWSGCRKVGFGSWGGHMQRQAQDDEWWTGAKPSAKPQAAPEKQ